MNKAQLVWVGKSLAGISYSPEKIKSFPGKEFTDTIYFRSGLNHHTFTLSDRRKDIILKEKSKDSAICNSSLRKFKLNNANNYISNDQRIKKNSVKLIDNIFKCKN